MRDAGRKAAGARGSLGRPVEAQGRTAGAQAWGSLGRAGATWGSLGQPGAAWGDSRSDRRCAGVGQPRAGWGDVGRSDRAPNIKL